MMQNNRLIDMRLQARRAREKGQLQEAARLYDNLLRQQSGLVDLWLDYGELMCAMKQWEKAEQAFRKSVALRPDYVLGWHNLGYLYQVLQRDNDAIDALKEAVRIDPDHVPSYLTLGTIYHNHGRDQEALECFDAAIALKPDFSPAHNNKGLILHKQGHLGAAMQEFLAALEHSMDDPGIHGNMGLVLYDMGQIFGAVRCYERALKLAPDNINALNNMGNALAAQGQVDEALVYYQKAIRIDPDFVPAHSNWMFYLLHKDGTTLEEVYDAHKDWAAKHAEPLKSLGQPHHNKKDPDRPLRIGFVSGDFRNHPVFYFTISTLTALYNDPDFHLTAYASQHDSDDCTPRAKAVFHQWHAVPHWTDQQLADQIRADGIDILIDLSGHNDRHRLTVFARKPAPVQVTWAGYMATTGLTAMDFLIGDHHQTPISDQPYYSEKLYPMPDSFIAYTAPGYAPPIAAEPPVLKNGFITFGCFNKPAKISRRCIETWSRILAMVPGSKLMMKFYGLQDAKTAGFFVDQFGHYGIRPDQLILEGPSRHADLLNSYAQRIDIALDSMPYTGSTTTLEALWMGVPVIARRGDIFPARHSASYLSSVGLQDWIADSDDEFVRKAVMLAQQPQELTRLRGVLRNQMARSPLCDGPRFAGHFKTALRAMWQAWCRQE